MSAGPKSCLIFCIIVNDPLLLESSRIEAPTRRLKSQTEPYSRPRPVVSFPRRNQASNPQRDCLMFMSPRRCTLDPRQRINLSFSSPRPVRYVPEIAASHACHDHGFSHVFLKGMDAFLLSLSSLHFSSRFLIVVTEKIIMMLSPILIRLDRFNYSNQLPLTHICLHEPCSPSQMKMRSYLPLWDLKESFCNLLLRWTPMCGHVNGYWWVISLREERLRASECGASIVPSSRQMFDPWLGRWVGLFIELLPI
jgi:hypothetical protein